MYLEAAIWYRFIINVKMVGINDPENYFYFSYFPLIDLQYE